MQGIHCLIEKNIVKKSIETFKETAENKETDNLSSVEEEEREISVDATRRSRG